MRRHTHVLLLALVFLGSAWLFLSGITWGLPSRAVDPFLFGEHPVWSGEQVQQNAGPTDADDNRPADVSAKPAGDRHDAAVLNETDEDRARIVRRYRLMSHQPDEFTTFAALARMKPGRGDLDPKMYKYGGLWIYPVGALLKMASAVGLVQLRPDVTFYLDHPEAFARFYIVARLYSVLWGLAAVGAVYAIVRRITASAIAAAAAAGCAAMMPVVSTAAHEAKPHLAGAALMLWAVYAAARSAETGSRRALFAAALLCGAAIAMVPSALPVLLVLPMLMLFRARARQSQVLLAGMGLLVAMAVYCVTNPYVPLNLVRHRELLFANVGNSAAFYRAGGAGALPNAALLIAVGMSLPLAIAGALGALFLGVRMVRARHQHRADETRRRSTGLLLAVPALVVAIEFVLFAGSQPADYARFALPFDLFLAIEAAVAIATLVKTSSARGILLLLLPAATAVTGLQYLGGFVRDAATENGRIRAARVIQQVERKGGRVLASRYEPAPWSMPPANLFEWKIVLAPRRFPIGVPIPGVNLTIAPVDFPPGQGSASQLLTGTPISWASKPFVLAGHAAGAKKDR